MALFATTIGRQRSRINEAIYCLAAIRTYGDEGSQLVCVHRGDVSNYLTSAFESLGIVLLQLPQNRFYTDCSSRFWPIFGDFGQIADTIQVISAGVPAPQLCTDIAVDAFADTGELLSVGLDVNVMQALCDIETSVACDLMGQSAQMSDLQRFNGLLTAAGQPSCTPHITNPSVRIATKQDVFVLGAGAEDKVVLAECRRMLADIGYAWDQDDALQPRAKVYDLTRQLPQDASPTTISVKQKMRNVAVKTLMNWRSK